LFLLAFLLAVIVACPSLMNTSSNNNSFALSRTNSDSALHQSVMNPHEQINPNNPGHHQARTGITYYFWFYDQLTIFIITAGRYYSYFSFLYLH